MQSYSINGEQHWQFGYFEVLIVQYRSYSFRFFRSLLLHTTSIQPKSTTTVFEWQTHPKFLLNLFSHTNHTVNWRFVPASLGCFEIISKPFCHGQLWQPIQEPNDGWPNLWTPKTVAGLCPECILQALGSKHQGFWSKSNAINYSIVAAPWLYQWWDLHWVGGNVLIPWASIVMIWLWGVYWYQKHDIVVAAAKKMDIELKQIS